jgi:hypothetical protein
VQIRKEKKLWGIGVQVINSLLCSIEKNERDERGDGKGKDKKKLVHFIFPPLHPNLAGKYITFDV